MTLTEDNLNAQAIENYNGIGCTGEAEFERDLELARKVAQQLNKMEREDPKANPRLMMNYVVTFFNVFKHEFALALLFHVTEQRNHPRLMALLVAMERVPFDYSVGVDLHLNTLNILRTELR